VAHTNGLYGDMGLNVLFYLPTNIIGFFMWKNHMESATVGMRGLRRRHQILVALVCVVSTAVLGFLLSRIKTQNTPYIDATLLMMWRFKEQWMLNIVLNVVTIVMWIIRLLHGSSDGILMILMWTAFLINAIYGYVNWKNGAKKIVPSEGAK